MGSVCTLSIGGYPLGETKGPPPEQWLSFFTPNDFYRGIRKVAARNPLIWGTASSHSNGRRESTCEYRTTASVVRDRLDLFGFSVQSFDEMFRLWRKSEGRLCRSTGVRSVFARLRAERARGLLGDLM